MGRLFKKAKEEIHIIIWLINIEVLGKLQFCQRIRDRWHLPLMVRNKHNTPTIIRLPFETMVRENKNLSLIRLNLNEAVVPESFGRRAIGISGDMTAVISDLNNRIGIVGKSDKSYL